MDKVISHLITELQSLGLRFDGQLLQRRGGAGPAEGGTFLIEGIPVSLPIGSEYVSTSPYTLREEGGQFLIFNRSQHGHREGYRRRLRS
ncbi:MAG: hypothetical protein KGZ49_10220 [Syntrophaceae bacterium]|nr:hypothetical protein [Syntrophaceae bacterium]